jgi:hypothetical protein
MKTPKTGVEFPIWSVLISVSGLIGSIIGLIYVIWSVQ